MLMMFTPSSLTSLPPQELSMCCSHRQGKLMGSQTQTQEENDEKEAG